MNKNVINQSSLLEREKAHKSQIEIRRHCISELHKLKEEKHVQSSIVHQSMFHIPHDVEYSITYYKKKFKNSWNRSNY